MCTFCEYCETLVTFPKGSRLIFILGCLLSRPSIRKVTGFYFKRMEYRIKSCFIPFHDLLEIFEFLVNLPSIYLWQYQGLDILLNDRPIMKILIRFENGTTYVSYTTVRLF